MKITQADYDLLLRWQTEKVKLTRSLSAKSKSISVKEGKLFDSDRELIPIEKRNEILNTMYNDAKTGFIGRDKLFYRVKQVYSGISRRDIAAFLASQETAQIHQKPAKLRPVKPIITSKPKERFQMDLIDMSSLAYFNNNMHWILTVIDHFTKKAWAFPLKTKGSKEVARHVSELFESGQVPSIMQSDNGKEFNNGDLSAIMKKHGVLHIFSTPYKPNSNGAIERFNGTLKGMLYKYMTNGSTKVWLSALPQLIENYNSAFHSVTGHTPDQAHKNIRAVAKGIKAQARKMVSGAPPKIEKGTLVRINNMHNPDIRKNKFMTKKYTPNYSKEVYRVASNGSTQYHIQDTVTGATLDTIFYSQDLKPIPDELIKPKPVKIKDTFWNREEHLRDLHSREVIREPEPVPESSTPIRSRKDRIGKPRRRAIPEPEPVPESSTPIRSRKDRIGKPRRRTLPKS